MTKSEVAHFVEIAKNKGNLRQLSNPKLGSDKQAKSPRPYLQISQLIKPTPSKPRDQHHDSH
jgi:hypothetical protein